MKESLSEVSEELLQNKIYFIRGKKVMFDRDLAELYGVETGALNRAVKRNLKRFPADFMFKIDDEEIIEVSRCQIGILKKGQNIKYVPYVFTEQGVAMLSGVLNSDRAISVNIQIMRMFTKLREIVLTNEQLRDKVEELEREQKGNFKEVFKTLRYLLTEEKKPKRKMGYRT